MKLVRSQPTLAAILSLWVAASVLMPSSIRDSTVVSATTIALSAISLGASGVMLRKLIRRLVSDRQDDDSLPLHDASFAQPLWDLSDQNPFVQDDERYELAQSLLYPPMMRAGSAEAATASAQADELLRDHLTRRQWKDYRSKQCFTVKVPGHGKVVVTNRDANNINADGGLWCVTPDRYMPPADRMLTLKLWLEMDPDHFFETAIWRGS